MARCFVGFGCLLLEGCVASVGLTGLEFFTSYLRIQMFVLWVLNLLTCRVGF